MEDKTVLTTRRAMFEHLYSTEQGPARNVIRKILFDPADQDDALALTFIRLWTVMERGPVETPERFIPVIAKGVAINIYRALKRRRRMELAVGLSNELAEIEEQQYNEGRRPLPEGLWGFSTEFNLAVRDLEDDGRHAFILTDLRGAGQAETALLLGTTQQDVSRRANRARTLIRKELF